MIIQNGTIEIVSKTGTGINANTGYVRIPEVTYGVEIPCQIIVNKYDKLGISKGEHFTVASYIILIEEQDFTAEQIRVKDASGNVLNTFSILSIEILSAVCEIKILV